MNDKKEVIDVSDKTFKEELVALSAICDKLNKIYKKTEESQVSNSSFDEDEKFQETNENVRKL